MNALAVKSSCLFDLTIRVIWAGPAAFSFDTLAAKYFADVMMMDMVGIAIPPEAQEKPR